MYDSSKSDFSENRTNLIVNINAGAGLSNPNPPQWMTDSIN